MLCFVFLGFRNMYMNQSDLNGFPVFRDYLTDVSITVNCSSCDHSFALPIPDV